MLFFLLPLAWIEELAPLLLVIFWVIRQIMSAVGSNVEEEEEEKPRRKPLTPEQKSQKQSVEQFLREIGAVPENQPEPDELEPVAIDPMKDQAGWATAEMAPAVDRISKGSIDPFEEPPRRKPERTVKKEPSTNAGRSNAGPSGSGSTGSGSSSLSNRSRRIEQKKNAAKQNSNQSGKRHAVVESHLAENASHLGEKIGQTDERIEARLHDKFDHRLGKLSHRESTPAEESVAKQSQAARILALLSSPTGVRDAIVINEILKPPVDRWD